MKCVNCMYYNDEYKKCIKNLNPDTCSEFKDFGEYWSEAYSKLCEWACENDVYDDVTSGCGCWGELEELDGEEYIEVYEDVWG